jgi:hypothetical protein
MSMSAASDMVALLDQLRSITDQVGRADLSHRLSLATRRVGDSRLRIVVAGQARQGMSSLVAAIADELARDGVILADTPGVTGSDGAMRDRSAAAPRSAAATLAQLPAADAVLFVSDASQEYTAPEVHFLEQVRQLCPTVACVITKIDGYVHWADIQKADRKHLDNARLQLPLLPVSSSMYDAARHTGDEALRVESGVPQLLEFVRTRLVGRAAELARESVVNDVRVVSDQIALALDSELTALRDPRRGAEVRHRLEAARDAAEQLRKRTANWQYVLGDGVTELTVAVDHDLRHRLRAIVRDADERIGSGDPSRKWDSFGAWLDVQVAESVTENFVLAHRLSTDLARAVAAKFAEDCPQLRIATTAAGQYGSLDALDSGKTGFVGRVVTSLRGSYGGVLMVGLGTSLIGLALVNPWSIGAGVLLGAHTFWEDRKVVKARRQAEAKQAVARLLDEAVFQVNDESKRRLREVQRTLRDYFTEVAEATARSADEALNAAARAVDADEGHRVQRIARVAADLGRLNDIRLRAAALVTEGT